MNEMITKTPTLGAPGLDKNASLPEDDPQHKANACPPQAEIEREFQRDEVFEAAEGAINYLMAIRSFAAADDLPGLRYSAAKFVAYARVVAAGCKSLTGTGQ